MVDTPDDTANEGVLYQLQGVWGGNRNSGTAIFARLFDFIISCGILSSSRDPEIPGKFTIKAIPYTANYSIPWILKQLFSSKIIPKVHLYHVTKNSVWRNGYYHHIRTQISDSTPDWSASKLAKLGIPAIPAGKRKAIYLNGLFWNQIDSHGPMFAILEMHVGALLEYMNNFPDKEILKEQLQEKSAEELAKHIAELSKMAAEATANIVITISDRARRRSTSAPPQDSLMEHNVVNWTQDDVFRYVSSLGKLYKPIAKQMQQFSVKGVDFLSLDQEKLTKDLKVESSLQRDVILGRISDLYVKYAAGVLPVKEK